MNNFNREKFLLWTLASLLGWQAMLFSYGTYKCTTVRSPLTVRDVCPKLGDRFETFTNTSLGAILGLLGGAAAIGAVKKKSE